MVNYWWVNQNQTYNHEVGGGYLWSPKANANGARNQFYNNMTLVSPGDIVFSFAETRIKAIGIAIDKAYTALKPRVFGSAGENWSNEGWEVPVEFKLVANPIRPKDFMQLISPLLPEKYSPLQKNGNGIQSVYLASLPSALGQLLMELTQAPELVIPVTSLTDLQYNEDEQDLLALTSLAETTRATLISARRGQGIFRSRVELIEKNCRVTGVSQSKLLVASHIKPWKTSDNQERLDGNNGLFLSPHVDKLFNDGYISFDKSGKLLVDDSLARDVLEKWNIDPRKNYGRFNSDQAYFLEYHNAMEFGKSRPPTKVKDPLAR